VDLDIGNIGSLLGALYNLGWDPIVVRDPNIVTDCSHLIIPGVGSFREGSKSLETKKLKDAILSFVDSQKPVLGICLGMHLLASCGEEGGFSPGLNLIPGRVTKFQFTSNLPLPHVGWNEVIFNSDHPVLEGIKTNKDFYFVHSYCFQPQFDNHKVAITHYGLNFASIVVRDNVIGTQFHPEKSQKNGLKLLDNFCMWDGNA